MKGATGQAPLQVGIHGGKVKGENFVQTLSARTLIGGKQPPQFMHDGRAASRLGGSAKKIGKSSGLHHLASLEPCSSGHWPWIRAQCSMYVLKCNLEQKENIAKMAVIIPLTHVVGLFYIGVIGDGRHVKRYATSKAWTPDRRGVFRPFSG